MSIRSTAPKPRLFIKEWRNHLGMTLEQVGERLNVARGQVSKWENEQHRLNPQKLANLEAAMGLAPGTFQRPPGRQSIDAMLQNADDELYATAVDIVARLVRPKDRD